MNTILHLIYFLKIEGFIKYMYCNKDMGLVLLKLTKSKGNPFHLDIVILVIKFTTSHDVHAKSQSDFYSVPAMQVHVLIYSQLE